MALYWDAGPDLLELHHGSLDHSTRLSCQLGSSWWEYSRPCKLRLLMKVATWMCRGFYLTGVLLSLLLSSKGADGVASGCLAFKRLALPSASGTSESVSLVLAVSSAFVERAVLPSPTLLNSDPSSRGSTGALGLCSLDRFPPLSSCWCIIGIGFGRG